MVDDSKIAAADPSRDISYPTMIVGLLTKQILPDATVLGFSRSASFVNEEFLNGKSEVYSIEQPTKEDADNFIEKTTENEELREKVLQQFEKIDESLRQDILFLKQIVKISLRGTNIQLGEIATASDLFITIILGNLRHQDPNTRSGYSELPTTEKENLKSVFKLCKENLQRDKTDYADSREEQNSAGVIKGTKIGDEIWKSYETNSEIPLKFLKLVGLFDLPPSDCGELTLTAQHLSFIEFSAAAGILLSSDIKLELEKIKNIERYKAVSAFMRQCFDSIIFIICNIPYFHN